MLVFVALSMIIILVDSFLKSVKSTFGKTMINCVDIFVAFKAKV